MNILLVGALAWNPERVLSLSDQGHGLFGLWSRTMAWEQGPYPFARNRITKLNIEGAIDLLHEGAIDIVYSLFHIYDRKLWSPDTPPGLADVWVLLGRLLHERDRGTFRVPIVRHWGFDVHNLDLKIVRALDGQIFCNRQQMDFWTLPASAGGCGLDLGCGNQEIAFMDSDLPSRKFMNKRFAPKISSTDGDIHTVCIGRPLGIDLVKAAMAGIHVHVYGNNYDDIAFIIASGLSPSGFSNLRSLLNDYLHVHPSIQPTGKSLDEINGAKDQWVEEFSRYDAG